MGVVELELHNNMEIDPFRGIKCCSLLSLAKV